MTQTGHAADANGQGTLGNMDKAEHGSRLKAAIARKGYSREDIAAAASTSPRSVTNWTSGKTMPSLVQREVLRTVLGPYDEDGDPVELAVRSSELIDWRQDAVLSTYKRHLYEQREERAG